MNGLDTVPREKEREKTTFHDYVLSSCVDDGAASCFGYVSVRFYEKAKWGIKRQLVCGSQAQNPLLDYTFKIHHYLNGIWHQKSRSDHQRRRCE